MATGQAIDILKFDVKLTSNFTPDFSLQTSFEVDDTDFDAEFYLEELEAYAICHILNKKLINIEVEGNLCYIYWKKWGKAFCFSFILPLNKDMLTELEEFGILDDFALEEALHQGALKIEIS